MTAEPLRWGTARARWVVAATVLGSGLTFVDASVVTIALPALGEDLDAGSAALTWVVNGYTLTLAALVLLGGSLGDRFGRRRLFVVGTVVFAVASLACGLAPTAGTLVAARLLQGVGGALLTPGSLAILQASFAEADRPRAIGAWSGLAGIAGAIGPFLGGWILDVASWRWIFLINLPVALAVVLVAVRHVPESRSPTGPGRSDVAGSVLLVGALAAWTWALTRAGDVGFGARDVWPVLLAGSGCAVVFVWWERRAADPLLPLSLFGSRVFSAVNVVTFLLYGALGALFFALPVALQVGSGYAPLASGLMLLPVTVLMLLLSSRAGALMSRVGPRLPMTVGPVLAAAAAGWLALLGRDPSYFEVLAPMALFGLGLVALVTPLTATVLAAVPQGQIGVASGVNNAVARMAGLLAVAAIPVVAGLGGDGLVDPERVVDGFRVVAWACAGGMLLGGLLSWLAVPGPGQASAEGPASPLRAVS